MDSNRWKQVDSVLLAAMERAPEERDAFLRQACAGDAELEREIRSLLTSQQHAGGFLENRAIEVAALALAQHDGWDTQGTSDLPAGRTISHYRIMRKLGAGGMGVVYEARDTRLQRHVALKFLSGELARHPSAMNRFLREARAASALNHPNIITIYDVGRANIGEAEGEGQSVDFIAMELAPGKALDQLVSGKGLPLTEGLHYAAQVADALAAAHATGIVHRDLKPGNLMVSESGLVKVLDFGLATVAAKDRTGEFPRTTAIGEGIETDRGLILGTVSYMSPEQAEGNKVDERSDIFSFGAVLYEMITGRRAFGGDSVASILAAILRDEPAPASEIQPGLPREFDRIVMRCLQKDPGRRYQHAGDLKIDLQSLIEELPEGRFSVRGGPPKRRRWWWIAAAAGCAAISLVAVWGLHGFDPSRDAWIHTRITNEAGFSDWPALSRDGKLLAYSSDRGLEGTEIFVKQIAGGQSIRLTSGGATNLTPDFSPDGNKVVYWSNQKSGVYEIPALGGEARLLAPHGLNPKYSPDGSLVAYWVGSPSLSAAVPGSGAVWVVPVTGGEPRNVGTGFTSARNPIWLGDGRHLLFLGYTSSKNHDDANLDWWVVSPNGGDAVRTGAYEALVRAGLLARNANKTSVSGRTAIPRANCWSAVDNAVVFSIASGDTQNLWQIVLSRRTGQVTGITRLTTGSGREVNPACGTGGALAFTNVENRRDIWSLPYDLDSGTPKGTIEQITQAQFSRAPSLSHDGHFLAFVSNESGRANVWTRELASGRESSVSISATVQQYPVSNSSGSRTAFSVSGEDRKAIYASSPGGVPEIVCEGCLRATDWSRDDKTLLVFGGTPYQIDILDLATHRQTPLLKHSTYNLLYGRFSPDNRWVSFTARMGTNRGRIAIAPTDGPNPIPETAWITIADAWADDFANWSPDGRTLYFTSRTDGNNCLWAQRLEAESHRPVGEAFAVQHLHGRLAFDHLGWSAAGGRIVLALLESSGSIWMMSRR